MARKSSSAAEQAEETVSLAPRLNEHLIAHEAAEKQLLRLINADRLPHALLITGPRGIGKTTLAHRLARFLLSPRETGGLFGDALPPESMYLSPAHPTFRRIIAGAHPDLLVLAADDIKIEDARAVSAFFSLTPAESVWRVVIVDSADALNRNAANALLKILEEPPPQALLILVSHNPGTLLPTIRSRCRTIRLQPLNEADFARVMAIIAPQMTAEECRAMALLSDYSPGVALALMETDALALYSELLERITDNNTLKLHAFAERFARKDAAREWGVLTKLLPWIFLRIVTVKENTSAEAFAGERQLLRALADTHTLDFWTELWEKTGALIADAERLYLDRKQILLTVLREAAGQSA